MFFGLINIPAIFQIYINNFLVWYFHLFKNAYKIYSTRQKNIKTIQKFQFERYQEKTVFLSPNFSINAKRGADDSHIKQNYNMAVFPLMGITTVSNGKKMIDQKTTFIIKFIYRYNAYGSRLINNRNVADFSLMGIVTVSN